MSTSPVIVSDPTTDEQPSSKRQKLTEDDEEEKQDIAEAIVAAASAAATAAVLDAAETTTFTNSCHEEDTITVVPVTYAAIAVDPMPIVPPDSAPTDPTAANILHVASEEHETKETISNAVETTATTAQEEPAADAPSTTNPGSPFVPRVPPAHYVSGIQPTTKHDEKWNEMFYKLQDYKTMHGHCLVPQNHQPDIKLGRWVHYQRVEFWLYQQRGQGKITAARIQVLERAGFEWDPQRAQWNILYERLAAFKRMHGHCQVPKGFKQDKELANWVRNQRLEYTNKLRGKKNRMTEDRQVRLEALGFKWSAAISGLGCPQGDGVEAVPPDGNVPTDEVVPSDEGVPTEGGVATDEGVATTMVDEKSAKLELNGTVEVVGPEETIVTMEDVMIKEEDEMAKEEELIPNGTEV